VDKLVLTNVEDKAGRELRLIGYFLLKMITLEKSEPAIEPISSDLFILLPSSKRHSTITAVPLILTINISFFSPKTS
jgi:hypothetical protein